MSERLTASQLAHRVYRYLLVQYSAEQLQNTYYTMDTRVLMTLMWRSTRILKTGSKHLLML